MRGAVLKRISDITTEFDPTTIRPDASAPVVLVADKKEEDMKVCVDFAVDMVTVKLSADKLMSGVSSKPLKLDFQAVSQSNKCFEVDAELVHNKTQKRENVVINHMEHTLSFTPSLRGRYELQVSVNGQSVQGSPFPLSVAPDPVSLGKPVRVIKELNRPWGVAINSKGHVIVTENNSHQVAVFDKEWRKIRSFGGLCDPRDVTVDDDDNIYVADYSNHRIQKFTSDGEFIASVGSHGDSPLQFNYPQGVGYNKANGKKIFSTFDKVQVLNQNLTFHATFGKQGIGDGKFNVPVGISPDSAGNVLVADRNNNRIQVFTADGKFIYKLGNIKRPRGVVVDHSTGTVYVSKMDNRVSMYTATGEHIQSFGSKGSGDGQFDYPAGIVINEDENIIVADLKNDRLQIF